MVQKRDLIKKYLILQIVTFWNGCNDLECLALHIIENESRWTAWSACTSSCGQGIKTRFLLCSNSSECRVVEQNESCYQIPCNTSLKVWSKWSKCSQSCGEGIKIRFRICNNEIECKQEQKVETCVNRQCGKDFDHYEEHEWEAWSLCSVTCGQGISSRKSLCFGQLRCANLIQSQPCYLLPCVSLDKSDNRDSGKKWSSWSACTVSCGSGEETRRSICLHQPGCISVTEKRFCFQQNCSEITKEWSKCSVTCGRGFMSRYRNCLNVDDCKVTLETHFCVMSPCENSTMTLRASWSPWSQCSFSCGGGEKVRFRLCGINDVNCRNEHETSSCNNQPCFYDNSRKDLGTVFVSALFFLSLCLFIPFCVLRCRRYRFEKPLDLLKREKAIKTHQHDDNKVPNGTLTKEFHDDSVSLNLQVSPFEKIMKKLLFGNSDILDDPANNINNILDDPANNINNKYPHQSSPIYRLQIDNKNNCDSEHLSYDFHQANVFLDSAPTSRHKKCSPLDDEAFQDSFTSAIKEKVRQAKTVYVLDEVHRAIMGNITVTPLPSIVFKDPQTSKINIDVTTEAQHEIDQVAFDDHNRKNFECNMPKENNNESDYLSKTPSYINMQNEFVIKDQPCVVTFPVNNFKILNEELPITHITNVSNEYQNALIYVPCNLQSDEDEIKKLTRSSEISCCSRLSKRECVPLHSSCKHDKSVQTAISKINKRSVKILTDCNELSRNDSYLSKSLHHDFVNNDIHYAKKGYEDGQKDKNELLRNPREKVFNFNATQEKHIDICTFKVSHKNCETQVIADDSNVSKINPRIVCQKRSMVFQQCPESYQFNSTCAPTTYHIRSEDKLAMLGVQKCSVRPNYLMSYPHTEFSSSDPRRLISHNSKPHRTPIISNFLPLPKPIQHRFIPDYSKLPHVLF